MPMWFVFTHEHKNLLLVIIYSGAFVGSRYYARNPPHYDLFGKGRRPGDEEFRKAWDQDVDEEDCLWTGTLPILVGH